MAGNELDWEAVLQAVRNDYPSLYRAWFAELAPGELQAGELRVEVENPSWFQYLRDRCTQAFADAAAAATGHLVCVRFVCPHVGPDTALPAPDCVTSVALNPDYTFEEFVVGPCNRLAHAACQAICNQPGTLYNPLFVHAGPGLGKTHLLQATCVELRRRMPGWRVIYLSCEEFVNDFVRAMEQGRVQAFREQLRGAGALILDDVQFLRGRESSQEELFHTFNALHQSRRQIVLSGDAAPAQIGGLQERLVSRFNWGLVAQMDQPNREMRHAILRRKARLHAYNLPSEVLDYLAEQQAWSIRELEGALARLATEQLLFKKPLTLEALRQIFAAEEQRRRRPVELREILQVVAEYFGVSPQELIGRRRARSVAYPRQVAMYLARQLTPLSLQEIGVHFGNRDHSTVLHAERVIGAECQQSRRTADLIELLKRRLRR
jgi:chromosomal replication initiator protein